MAVSSLCEWSRLGLNFFAVVTGSVHAISDRFSEESFTLLTKLHIRILCPGGNMNGNYNSGCVVETPGDSSGSFLCL